MAIKFGVAVIILNTLDFGFGEFNRNSPVNQPRPVHISSVRTASATSGSELLGWRPDYLAEEESMKTSALPGAIGTLPSYLEAINHSGSSTMSIDASSDVGVKFGNVDSVPRPYYEAMDTLARNKRTLTFPDPSTILLIFGLGTPLQLDRESVILGAFTKMVYNLPLNSTDFTEPGVYFARTKTRWSIYKVLERAAELYGYAGGKVCLLRAICEVAAAPFDLHHGLFGQMVQAFLTPSSTSEPYDEYGDQEYHAAERLGRHADENCHTLYPECERSFLDVFSATTNTGNDTSADGSLVLWMTFVDNVHRRISPLGTTVQLLEFRER